MKHSNVRLEYLQLVMNSDKHYYHYARHGVGLVHVVIVFACTVPIASAETSTGIVAFCQAHISIRILAKIS